MSIKETLQNSGKQKKMKTTNKAKQKEGKNGELCPEITIVNILVYIFIYREKYYDTLISKDDILLYIHFSNFHTKRNHILYHGMIFCNIIWYQIVFHSWMCHNLLGICHHNIKQVFPSFFPPLYSSVLQLSFCAHLQLFLLSEAIKVEFFGRGKRRWCFSLTSGHFIILNIKSMDLLMVFLHHLP